MFPSSYHHGIFRSYCQWQTWCPCKRSRSEVKGHSYIGQNQFSRFRTVTPVWIIIWQWNDVHGLTLLRRGVLFLSRSSVKFQSHTAKIIVDFDPNWAFPDCKSSLNSPMAIKLCNYAHGLKELMRGALLLFNVIRQFSRSRGAKNVNFDPNWTVADCNSSLNIVIALKCCTKLDVVQERCPIVF